MSEAIRDEIDAFRMPRVIPADAFVIDAFPLYPIPERFSRIKADLLGELALAQAPFSGRRVACILAGDNEGYGGHTIERSPTDIDDPFMMALSKVPQGATLHGIAVAGADETGNMKEKHTLPSGNAYDAIAPLLAPQSLIVVLPPNQTDVCRVIPESRHQSAYAPKASSIFKGQTFEAMYSEAIRYTSLSMEDCMFAVHLRVMGLRDGIHYYLTGSANGDSGPSVLLKPGMYEDLDIIAVADISKAQIEASFEASASKYYGPLKKTSKVVAVAGSDRTIAGCIYSNQASQISIDFFAANRLEDAFVRPEYRERNYFHQLS